MEYSALLLSTAVFIFYLLAGRSVRINEWFQSHFDAEKASLYYILSYRMLAFFLFGILPFIISRQILGERVYELHFMKPVNAVQPAFYIITLLLVITAVAAVRMNANTNTAALIRQYPQLRSRIWNRNKAILYVSGWFIYLLAYEYLFRGFLLYSLIKSFTLWPGILLNTALYALAHLHKGKKETIASFPFGFVMCVLTYASGTFLFSLFIHFCMAAGNTYYAFRKNPEMSFIA